MIKLAALRSRSRRQRRRRCRLAPLVIRDFTLQFDPAGTFSLSGAGWPTMAGTWTSSGNEVTLTNTAGPKDCTEPGALRVRD